MQVRAPCNSAHCAVNSLLYRVSGPAPLCAAAFPGKPQHTGICWNRISTLSPSSSTLLPDICCLQHATQDSLVVLDELGRGTSTFDGYAIAHAVLQHLSSQVDCRLLFATHYHPLTSEFASNPRVRLGHMSALVGTSGLPCNSCGFVDAGIIIECSHGYCCSC